jgi:hypothetical protein
METESSGGTDRVKINISKDGLNINKDNVKNIRIDKNGIEIQKSL